MNKIMIALSCMLVFASAVDAGHCQHGQGGRWDAGTSRGAQCQHGPGHHHGGSGYWAVPSEAASRINPIPRSDASVAKGRSIYRENCTQCHGEYGMGDGPVAASLAIRPSNMRHTARHDMDGEIAWKINTGRDPMPSWKDALDEQQVWDLVNFLRTEFGQRHGRRHGHGHGHGRGHGRHHGHGQGHAYGGKGHCGHSSSAS